MSLLELISVILVGISMILVGKKKVNGWLLNILGTGIMTTVTFGAQLYYITIFQICMIGIAFYNFISWRKSNVLSK